MTAESQRWDAELGERATPAPLLQTWAWGEVQARAGWTIERVRLDLWGVPPTGAGRDPMARLGQLKRGFGGRLVELLDAWQVVLSGAGSRLIDLEQRARRGVRGLKRNIS